MGWARKQPLGPPAQKRAESMEKAARTVGSIIEIESEAPDERAVVLVVLVLVVLVVLVLTSPHPACRVGGS